MSENKLSIRQSKNNSRISPNKSAKLCDESKKFDTVKAATQKAITYGKGFGDLMDTPSSSIPMLEKKCIKLIRCEKGDKSRIPVNKNSDSQYIDKPPRQYQGVNYIKPSESKFGFRLIPNKLQCEKIENEPQLSFVKETSDHKSHSIEKVLKSLRETGNASEFSLARSSQKAEVKSVNSSPAIEEIAEASNQATKVDPSLDETFVKPQCSSELIDEATNQATKTEPPLDETFSKPQCSSELIDEASNQATKIDPSLDETFVKPQHSSELIDETSNQAKTGSLLDDTFEKPQCSLELIDEISNQTTKIDPFLDETFVKPQRLSELIDETSNQATKTELPLDETFVKSNESSNQFPVCGNLNQSSSQTGTSSRELISTDLKREYNALNKSETISCSPSKCSEENGLFEDYTFEPLRAINVENAPQRENDQNNTTEPQCAVDSKTTTRVEILKQQLEDLSLKLYRNNEYLTKATQLKRILVQKMESGVDVSTEDDLSQQMEKFAEVVDTHTSQVSAIGEEIQSDGIGDRDQVYPVPWAGVKTVGFLFSLVGSDNVVSLSPREAATTINKDVLIAHYENYLRQAQSKLNMVATIKKILLDNLDLVEGRMKVIRSFMDSWGPLEDGSASREYYEEHRNLLLECRVYLLQAADDFNLLYGRTDQYAVERSGYLDELIRFLRTQVRLFPEYKYLGP